MSLINAQLATVIVLVIPVIPSLLIQSFIISCAIFKNDWEKPLSPCGHKFQKFLAMNIFDINGTGEMGRKLLYSR